MLPQSLSTQRLVLRPPRAADDGAIVALLNDPAIARMTARVPHPITLADIAGRRRLNDGGGERPYAVERDGALIGEAGVKPPGSGEPPVGRYMTFSAARQCEVDTIDFNLTAARYRTIIHD